MCGCADMQMCRYADGRREEGGLIDEGEIDGLMKWHAVLI
jgi:hypothetical protein